MRVRIFSVRGIKLTASVFLFYWIAAAEGQSEPPQELPIVTISTVDGQAREQSPFIDAAPDFAELRVHRTGDVAEALTVYYLVGGTATHGEDYRRLPGSIQLAAGEHSASIWIEPLDDEKPEPVESVVVMVIPMEIAPGDEPPHGYYFVGSPDAARASILDDDDAWQNMAPRVAVVSPPAGASLPGWQPMWVLAEASDSDGWVTGVEFFVDGQSIGVDEGELWSPDFAPHDLRPPHQFGIVWNEPTPGLHILTAVATDDLGLRTESAQVQIHVQEFNAQTVVQVIASDPEGAEGPMDDTLAAIPDSAQFTITRSGAIDYPLTVYFQLTGTALNGVDYGELSTSVVIPAGSRSVEVMVDPIDDAIVERTEDVILTLIPPICIEIFPPPRECYLVGRASVARVIILDNDGSGNIRPRVRLVRPVDETVFVEPREIELVAVVQDPDGWVPAVRFYSGDRLIGTAEVTFIREPDPGLVQRFSFIWRDAPHGRHELRARAVDDNGEEGESRPVHISIRQADVLPRVTIEATDSRASEGGVLTVIDAARFTVHRTGDVLEPLVVWYSIHGSAKNGLDYQELSGVVEIPAGEASATIEVLPIADGELEEIETVVLSVEPPACLAKIPLAPGCYRVGEPSWAVAGIKDIVRPVNLPPEVELVRPFPGAVYQAPAMVALATQARDPDGYVSLVEWFANDRKIGETRLDFVTPPPPGEVQVFEFDWREVPVGEYRLSTRATDEAGLQSPKSDFLSIVVLSSVEPPVVSLFVVDPVASEQVGADGEVDLATFKVRRSGALDRELTVHLKIEGTAENGKDYEELPQQVTIAAGNRWARIHVKPIADGLREDPETVIIGIVPSPTMGPIESYQIGSPKIGVGLVVDEGMPAVAPQRIMDCIHLQFQAEAGSDYRLEVSEDLQEWQALTEGRADATGLHHIEVSPSQYSHRFYRLRPLASGLFSGEGSTVRDW